MNNNYELIKQGSKWCILDKSSDTIIEYGNKKAMTEMCEKLNKDYDEYFNKK